MSNHTTPAGPRFIARQNTERERVNNHRSRSAVELLKAFSHPTRLAILQELCAGPKCVTDLEEILPARQANISQHLAVLRHASLVDYAQDGSLRCYYLSRPKLVKDMFALVGRNDPIVKRTSKDIQADKERLTKAATAMAIPRRRCET